MYVESVRVALEGNTREGEREREREKSREGEMKEGEEREVSYRKLLIDLSQPQIGCRQDSS